MKNLWWKILTVILLLYTVTAGYLLPVPRLNILNETIRNLYFHVPMWFGMLFILTLSVVFSIRYLSNPKERYDIWAVEAVNTGIVYGILGLITGMWWAKFTWGDYWSGDPKQNAAAIAMLIYLGYIILRGAFNDDAKQRRISAVFNIFAFALYIPLLYILPRLQASLHPGAEGNPAFSSYDLDSGMRMVFYPAVIGWILLAFWITKTRVELRETEERILDKMVS